MTLGRSIQCCRPLISASILASTIMLSGCESSPTALHSSNVIWKYPSVGLFFGDPSFDEDRVFLVYKDKLVAIQKATGDEAWSFVSPDGGIGTETIPVSLGRIYMQTHQSIYAFDTRTGERIWHTVMNGFWNGVFLGGGVALGENAVYAIAYGGAVYKINQHTGDILWYTEIFPQPTKGLEADGYFCIGSNSQDFPAQPGAISCLDADNGSIIWSHQLPEVCTGGGVPGRPIIEGRVVVVGDQCGQLIAYDLKSGETVWAKRYNTAFDSDLVVASHVGYACLRTSACISFSLESGDIIWESGLFASALEAPTIQDGILWITDLSGTLIELDATSGVQVLHVEPPDDGGTFFSKPIVDDHTLFSGGGDFFYAIERP